MASIVNKISQMVGHNNEEQRNPVNHTEGGHHHHTTHQPGRHPISSHQTENLGHVGTELQTSNTGHHQAPYSDRGMNNQIGAEGVHHPTTHQPGSHLTSSHQTENLGQVGMETQPSNTGYHQERYPNQGYPSANQPGRYPTSSQQTENLGQLGMETQSYNTGHHQAPYANHDMNNQYEAGRQSTSSGIGHVPVGRRTSNTDPFHRDDALSKTSLHTQPHHTTSSKYKMVDPTDAAQVPPSVMKKYLGDPIIEHDGPVRKASGSGDGLSRQEKYFSRGH